MEPTYHPSHIEDAVICSACHTLVPISRKSHHSAWHMAHDDIRAAGHAVFVAETPEGFQASLDELQRALEEAS